jgi:hypothetical protein
VTKKVVGVFVRFSCTASNSSSKRACATDAVLKSKLTADPSLAIKMNQIEAFTKMLLQLRRIVNGEIQIPVVVKCFIQNHV